MNNKIKYIIFFICFIFFLSSIWLQLAYSEQLDQMQQINSITRNIEQVVKKFIEKGLLTHEAGKKLIVRYNELPTQTKELFQKMSKPQVEERLSSYINSKRRFMGDLDRPLDNIDDFNWNYMLYDMEWAMVTVVSADTVSVNNIVSGPVVMISDGSNIFFEAGKEKTIVVPMVNNSFSIHASGVRGETVWHAENVGDSKSVYFPASYSEGVVLFINSQPSGADIYFNNKKYYKQTNTTCIRDPGRCVITIKKENYKIWTKEYNLKKGEKYNINANLEPSH